MPHSKAESTFLLLESADHDVVANGRQEASRSRLEALVDLSGKQTLLTSSTVPCNIAVFDLQTVRFAPQSESRGQVLNDVNEETDGLGLTGSQDLRCSQVEKCSIHQIMD